MTRVSMADIMMDESKTGERCDDNNVEESERSKDSQRQGVLETDTTKESETNRGRGERLLEMNGDVDDNGVPTLMVQAATPLPHPTTPDINNNNNENNNLLKSPHDDVAKEEDDDDAEDMSDDGGEEEEVEEEEEEPEMTTEEKKDMHECVKSGDIDSLEDCLDLPGADINMTWFRENLLMTAIRYDQKEMAEFLLDNGVDHTFTTSIVGMRETAKGRVLERYQLTCRQMAYDKEMSDIVDLIDSLQGQLFSFIRLPQRMPRFRRPRPPTPSEAESESDETSEGADISSEGENKDELSKEGGSEAGERKQQRRKKRKKKKEQGGEGDDVYLDGKVRVPERGGEGEEEDVDWERDKTLGGGSGADIDSGHHSLASSKLKMAMLREHDRLMEKEEKEEEEQRGQKEESVAGSSNNRRKLRKAKNSSPSDVKEKSGSVKSGMPSLGKSEAVRDEGGSAAEEHDGTRDEGYEGSTSLHSGVPEQPVQQITSPEQIRPWDSPPKNRIRSTKSALTATRSLQMRYGRRVLSGNALHPHYSQSSSVALNVEDDSKNDISNVPLRWKKVSTVGSYARESKQWHQAHPNGSQEATPAASVEISEIKLLEPPYSNGSLNSSASSKKNSIPATKDTVLPKSMTKSNSPATTSSTSSGLERLSTSTAATITQSGLSSTSGHPIRSRHTPVAGYMRATKSTAIKCRLTPRFSSNYGALDFQTKSEGSSKATPVNASVHTTENHKSDNIRLALSALSSQLNSSDVPLAPRMAGKQYTIPVLTSGVGEHQKRNQRAISFRS